MLITQANMEVLFTSVEKRFEQAYMSTPADLTTEIAQIIPSNTLDQLYPFAQAISGAMRQWVGERQVNNMVLDKFSVRNLLWENTIGVTRSEVADDQYGAFINMIVPNLARHAKLLSDVQIAASIAANPVAFDGVNFFATNHPIDPSGQTPGTYSNLLSSGYALNSTNLAKAQAAMMSFKGPDGIPMGCYGNVLLVPPSLKYTADVLANSTFFPDSKNAASGTFGSQTNVFRGQYKVVASPYIADTGDPTTATWYLLDCRDDNLRPFFWQQREAPQLVSLVDPANTSVFFLDQYFFGVRSRGASSIALPFKAIKAVP
jgi:phage major head subunit gpT-like protein